jgi:hypothetical protein
MLTGKRRLRRSAARHGRHRERGQQRSTRQTFGPQVPDPRAADDTDDADDLSRRACTRCARPAGGQRPRIGRAKAGSRERPEEPRALLIPPSRVRFRRRSSTGAAGRAAICVICVICGQETPRRGRSSRPAAWITTCLFSDSRR